MTRIRKFSWAFQGVLVLVFACLLPSTFAAGVVVEKERLIRNWDTEEGLPSSHVSVLASTPDGYLWIGTSDGLLRYDGVRFAVFNSGNAPVFSNNVITSLAAHRAGSLWIGTQNGQLILHERGSFKNIGLGGNLPSGPILNLIENGDGVLGILENTGIFSHLNGTTQLRTNGIPSPMIWGLFKDSEGTCWAISKWRLMRLQDGLWRAAEFLPPDFPRVCHVAPSPRGGLWIACVGQAGVRSGDGGTRIFRYQNGKLAEDTLVLPWNQDSRRTLARFLMEDRQGRVWCAMRGGGIFVRDDTKWELLSERPQLSQIQAGYIHQDEDLNVWLGMEGAGLFQLRQKFVSSLEPPAGQPPVCFWTVYAARDGSVWGGTDGNGVYRWNNGFMTRYGCAEGLSDLRVNAVLEDRNTNLWAGTMDGLFCLRNDRFEPVEGAAPLRSPVFALKEDRAGNIWVGTRAGIVQLGENATNVFAIDEGIPTGNINCIEEDRHGRIWAAIPPLRDARSSGPVGPYGLFRQAGNHFERVGQGSWSGELHIRSLQFDEADNLWIGTISAGFFRFSTGGFVQYSWRDGIPHDRIQAVVADANRNLWFCSELGIFGSPISQLENHAPAPNRRLNWWRLQRNDGLPNKSATGNGQPSAMRGSDGRIWFANGNSVSSFDPVAASQSMKIHPPIIEECFVGGSVQNLEPDGSLRIAAESRRVEIRYTSPNTSHPDLPTFWIRMKGVDDDWVQGSTARVASYNLEPGNHEFSVAVTGPDGTRLETTRPLRVIVAPRFLERLWVRIAGITLLVTGIVFAVWRAEKTRSDRQLRQLELQRAMDQVRQRIARDIHDDLGAGLTEITLLSDNLRADRHDPTLSCETAERIAVRARALTHEMDEVVWAIDPRTDTLESLATYLNDFAQERLALAGIRCRLNTAVELPHWPLPSDLRHSVYRAAKEALNNAIRHAGATEVVITIEPQGRDLLLIIQDNGKGFDPNRPRQRGNGLKNMLHRLEEIGGRCVIQSVAGAGTRISFTIPAAASPTGKTTLNETTNP